MQTTLFKPGEFVCGAFDAFGVSLVPIEKLNPEFHEFFCINPLKRGTSRKDANVEAFRNFLVELDDGTLEEQASYIEKELKMPFTTCTYSGKKSLHYIISLKEDVDQDTWRSLIKRILIGVPKADRTVSNPSRLSRTPGHIRKDTGKEQTLLAVRDQVSLNELNDWLNSKNVPREIPKVVKPKFLEGFKGIKLPYSIRTKGFLTFGAQAGGSHREAVLAAHNLRDCNYSKEEVEYLLSKAPWPTVEENEIENIVMHAFKGE